MAVEKNTDTYNLKKKNIGPPSLKTQIIITKNLYIVEYIYLFNYFDKSTPEKNEDTRYKDTNFDSSKYW